MHLIVQLTTSPVAIGLALLGIPVFAAVWLSDGFIGWRRNAPTAYDAQLIQRLYPNPRTGAPEVVPVNNMTGIPTRLPS